MTDQRYNKLVTRIFWFALPLIISLLVWIVLSISSSNEKIESIRTNQDASSKTEERMWKMVQDNNVILTTKADDRENKNDHNKLMEKLEMLDTKMDNIKNREWGYGYNPMNDTTVQLVIKVDNKTDHIAKDIDILLQEEQVFLPEKEESVLWTKKK